MPDWRVHTITEIKEKPEDLYFCCYLWIYTDKQIEWRDGRSNSFISHTFYPFTSWKVGDWIEIDFDETRQIGEWRKHPVRDDSPNIISNYADVVKSFELPAEASYEMRQRVVEAQKNGTNEGEFIAAQGSVQMVILVTRGLLLTNMPETFSMKKSRKIAKK